MIKSVFTGNHKLNHLSVEDNSVAADAGDADPDPESAVDDGGLGDAGGDAGGVDSNGADDDAGSGAADTGLVTVSLAYISSSFRRTRRFRREGSGTQAQLSDRGDACVGFISDILTITQFNSVQ